MADRVLIEEYRGVEIYFELDKETFYATIDDPEMIWNRPKKTFASVKKTIDEYIKETTEFKPFTAIFYDNGWAKEGKRYKIVSIRKDGQFVYEDEKGVHHQLSKYDEERYLTDTPENKELLAQLKVLDNERTANYEKAGKLSNQLESLNLKEIKKQYLI